MENKAKNQNLDRVITHLKQYRKSYTALAISTCLLLLIVSLYTAGYRVTENFTIGKVGVVTVHIPMPLTSVYIDSSKKITTAKDNETLELAFSPRTHTIIVARDGYYPWKKDIVVESGAVTQLFPLFVSHNASGQIITVRDPEYYTLKNQVLSNVLPTKARRTVSKDGLATLWVEDTAIMVETEGTTYTVITPDTRIRNVAFYKDRNDAVLFSTSIGIFVIEVLKEHEAKENQNFLPIYKGQKPMFIETDPNFIYVLDGDNLMQVII